tara:strand:+ start:49 stop:546 length:498 start_codon:yes stop_codon:yes gene_type:complete
LGTDLLAKPERWAMWIGDFNLEAGNPAKARDYYATVLDADPDFGLAHLQAADAHMQLGDLIAALDGYTQAIQSNADVGRAELGRGAALLALNQPEASLEAYNAALNALEEDRNHLRAEAQVGRSEVFLAMGDCGRARDALQRAWEMRPTMVLPQEKLQRCERDAP